MIAGEEIAAAHQLDPDNPWPGLEAFEERSRDFFHGRDREVEELARRVTDAPVTVLFGRSGVGKTSLLKAGLFPRLRTRGLLPVYVRLDVRADAPPLADQLRDALQRAFAQERVDAPSPAPDESLWEYLHRADFEVWNEKNALQTPVIVLDQFEEMFTLGEWTREQVERFRLELGDAAENRIPSSLADARAERLDLRRMRYKLIVSLREDFLPDLEGWRRAMPTLGRTRVRLFPMSPEQALEAVYGSAAHLMDPEVAREIVSFVAAERVGGASAAGGEDRHGHGDVEPALLSLFCAGLNARRKKAGLARIDAALLEGARQGIVSDYYRSCVEGLPDRVSRFIEAELISEKGWRNSFAREDAVPAHLTAEELERLIRRRLLRVEERHGTQRIELSHDLLTRAVREHRDRRRAEEEKAELARRAEEERRARQAETRALQEEFERQRQREREEQLVREVRAGRRFKWLAAGLAVALVVLLGMSALAYRENRHADEQRVLAVSQSGLAGYRLDNIKHGVSMKQAVLAGASEQIRAYLESGLRNRTIRFTARAEPLGYKDRAGRPVYRFSVFPLPDTLAADRGLGLVTYRMDHPTFRNSLMVTGPDRSFVSTYDGWGCLCSVVALLEYTDPDRPPQIAQFNMCQALGPEWAEGCE